MAETKKIPYVVKNSPIYGTLIRYQCPSCGDRLTGKPSEAGETHSCSVCGVAFVAPGIKERREQEAAEAAKRLKELKAKQQRERERAEKQQEKEKAAPKIWVDKRELASNAAAVGKAAVWSGKQLVTPIRLPWMDAVKDWFAIAIVCLLELHGWFLVALALLGLFFFIPAMGVFGVAFLIYVTWLFATSLLGLFIVVFAKVCRHVLLIAPPSPIAGAVRDQG